MAAKAKLLTEEQIGPAVNDLIDEIVNGDDTQWQRYAEQMSREAAAGMKLGLFNTWSAYNRFNLAAQVRARGVSVHGLYAGVAQWRKLEREIREGEKPYFIYGSPVVGTKNSAKQDDSDTEEESSTKTSKATYKWRRPPLIAVYEYSQTVSTDPYFEEPDWALPLAGGDFATLQTLAASSPVEVTFKDVASRPEHGWLTKDELVVDSSRSVAKQIAVLAHELAHYHLGHLGQLAAHRKNPDKKAAEYARCEQEAELTAFFVMKMLGLDESIGVNITAAAGQYLRSWTKENKAGDQIAISGIKGRRRLIKERFATAFAAAQKIVTAYVQTAEADTVEQVEQVEAYV